jgi:uncharacterized protein (TIGR03067 family)
MLMRCLLFLLLVSPAFSFADRTSPLPPPMSISESQGTSPSQEAADESSPASPGQPGPAAGPLVPDEQKLQGRWQAYDVDKEFKLWAFEFSGRTFTARTGDDDWYEGHIAIRSDGDPAQLDFVIDDCRCGYKGMTSQAIYRWNGDALVVSAPTPGDPRPEHFRAASSQMMHLLRSNP